jgi:hypothetical protein
MMSACSGCRFLILGSPLTSVGFIVNRWVGEREREERCGSALVQTDTPTYLRLFGWRLGARNSYCSLRSVRCCEAISKLLDSDRETNLYNSMYYTQTLSIAVLRWGEYGL